MWSERYHKFIESQMMPAIPHPMQGQTYIPIPTPSEENLRRYVEQLANRAFSDTATPEKKESDSKLLLLLEEKL